MIKEKTLFILGAGASCPFGYPTGIKLRDDIISRSHKDFLIEAITPNDWVGDYFIKQVDKFIDEFSKSSLYSIDLFLEKRPEFMELGKMAIASHLIEHEFDRRLRDNEDNWYMYLYDRLKASFDDFEKNNIAFITFNYDRSLEQFFFEAFRSTFNKSDEECASKLKKIPIVHLYGRLDPFPWEDSAGFPYLYSKNVHIMRLIKAPENFKLISAEREMLKSKEFDKAHELIIWAKRIFFLGFGFDETNMKRLEISLMKEKHLFATSLGLTQTKKNMIHDQFVALRGNGINSFLETDSLNLLEERLPYE